MSIPRLPRKKLKNLCAILLCSTSLLLMMSEGGAHPVLQPGKLIFYTRNPNGVAIKTEHAQVELTVFSPGVIRVRMDKKSLGSDFSYADTGQAIKTDIQLTELDGDTRLASPGFGLNTSRNLILTGPKLRDVI